MCLRDESQRFGQEKENEAAESVATDGGNAVKHDKVTKIHGRQMTEMKAC